MRNHNFKSTISGIFLEFDDEWSSFVQKDVEPISEKQSPRLSTGVSGGGGGGGGGHA